MLHDDEISRLRQTAAADPSQYVRLCDLLVAAGRAEEAVSLCRQELAGRPDDVELRLALGRALSAAGNLEEAQAALLDAVARKRRKSHMNIPIPGTSGAPAAPLPLSNTSRYGASPPPAPPPPPPSGLSPRPSGISPTPAAPASSTSGARPAPSSSSSVSGLATPPPEPVGRELTGRYRSGLSGTPAPEPPGRELTSRYRTALSGTPAEPPGRELTSRLRLSGTPPPEPVGRELTNRFRSASALRENSALREISALRDAAALMNQPPAASSLSLSAPAGPFETGEQPRLTALPEILGALAASAAGEARQERKREIKPEPRPEGPSPTEPEPQRATRLEMELQRPLAEGRFSALPVYPSTLAAPQMGAKAPPVGPPSHRPLAPLPEAAARVPSALLPATPASPPTSSDTPGSSAARAELLDQLAMPSPLGGGLDVPEPITDEEPSLAAVVLAAAAGDPVPARPHAPLAAPPPAPAMTLTPAPAAPSGRRTATPVTPARASISGLASPAAPEAAVASPAMESQPPSFELDRIAALLRGPALAPPAEIARPAMPLFDQRRARTFGTLWICLALVGIGIVGGWTLRTFTTATRLKRYLNRAAQQQATARYHDDVAARDLYLQATRLAPRDSRAAALLAEAEARLAADHGEGNEDNAFVLLRRAEQASARGGAPSADVRAAMRRAAMLLSLARGEPCPALSAGEQALSLEQDGDVAARCALLGNEIETAWRVLTASSDGVAALLGRGALALSLGDLEEADHAYRTVLDRLPGHPRAQLGRGLVAVERGQDPRPYLPADGSERALGRVASSLWHLLRGGDEAALDQAQAGWRYDVQLALRVGRARLAQGRLSEAEEGLRAAQRRFPSDPGLLTLDAEVALAKGYGDKVAATLRPLQGQPSVGPRVLVLLGRAQYLSGDLAAAQGTLTQALQSAPRDLVALSYRALLKARQGGEREAFQELEQLSASRPLPVTTPHYALALLAYERKDLDRAAAQAREALVRNPEAAQARALLGRVLREQGKLAEALAVLSQVAAEAPALPVSHQLLGRTYLDLGRARDARREFLQLTRTGRPSAEDWLALAQATASLGSAREAELLLERAQKAGALGGRIERVALELQTFKGPGAALAAAQRLEQERRLSPRDPQLALAVGQAYLRAGSYPDAQGAFEAARARSPVAAQLGLARVQLHQRKGPEAEAAYQSALALLQAPGAADLHGPDAQVEARAGLCQALLLRRAGEEAHLVVKPALDLLPDSVEATSCMARVLGLRGQVDEGLAMAQRAAAQDPQSGEACLAVADLTAKRHTPEEARARYQRCLELNLPLAAQKYARGALGTLR